MSPKTFLAIAPSKNLGCFSIEPTITIAHTIRAKTGIVTMNQSKSVLMNIILTMIDIKSRKGELNFQMNQTSTTTRMGDHYIKHIVCFKFLDTASPSEVEKIEEMFLLLQEKIPGVLKIEGGENNSPENLNKGLTHCFIITFKDEAARANYLPHPEHQNFVTQLKPQLDDVLVIDFKSHN